MKTWLKGLSVFLVASVVFIGCAPFVFTTNSLKGKTITYVGALGMSANGHDVSVLVFDKTGAAGTFENKMYDFYYPTQAAADSGKYTDKTWFQTDGQKGTFTYDAKTLKLVATITELYQPKPTATALTGVSGTHYAAADYAYQALKTLYGVDSASQTQEMQGVITQDNMMMAYVAGSTADTWVNTQTMTSSTTSSGVTFTNTQTSTTTLTIKSGSFVEDYVVVSTASQTGQPDQSQTSEYRYDYTISQFFLIGEDTGTKTFDKVWKKGNAVTFNVSQTKYSEIKYTNTAAKPAAPTVDPTTGTGVTGTRYTIPYYYIDARGGNYSQWSLENAGDYIYETDQADSAARTLSE